MAGVGQEDAGVEIGVEFTKWTFLGNHTIFLPNLPIFRPNSLFLGFLRKMSRKRVATGDQLTGGTKDVNPQYMHGILTLSAANTTTEVTQGTPIVRVGPQSGGEAVIMEILKIFVDHANNDATNAAATAFNQTLFFGTTSAGTTTRTFDDPRVFAMYRHGTFASFTAAGTGLQDIFNEPGVVDLTDGAGHGILVATDNIYVQGSSAAMTGAGVFRWKILYRFKRVSLVEYIGIVQSQQ